MIPPILAITGFSGAGKTTAIEACLPRLGAAGLSVGVIKHDAHGLDFDRPGKDTWRLARAGAARVEAWSDDAWFATAPGPGADGWDRLPRSFRDDLDIVLVEGGRGASLDRIWILASGEAAPPPGVTRVVEVLGRDAAVTAALDRAILGWLEARWAGRPTGVVEIPEAGGPVAIDGGATLPPAPGVPSPMGGLVAAMRHDPSRAWATMPANGGAEARKTVDDLIRMRRPGTWVIAPARPLGPAWQTAIYEPQIAHVLEEAAAAGVHDIGSALSGHPKVRIVR